MKPFKLQKQTFQAEICIPVHICMYIYTVAACGISFDRANIPVLFNAKIKDIKHALLLCS